MAGVEPAVFTLVSVGSAVFTLASCVLGEGQLKYVRHTPSLRDTRQQQLHGPRQDASCTPPLRQPVYQSVYHSVSQSPIQSLSLSLRDNQLQTARQRTVWLARPLGVRGHRDAAPPACIPRQAGSTALGLY